MVVGGGVELGVQPPSRGEFWDGWTITMQRAALLKLNQQCDHVACERPICVRDGGSLEAEDIVKKIWKK